MGRVLRALHPTGIALNVIVAIADGPSGPAVADRPGPGEQAQNEIRRSLQLLAGDSVALARALSRPLAIDRLGVQPLGNLLLESLTSALGELTTASEWLGEQLGIDGAVLPASDGPVRCTIEQAPDGPRLRLTPESPAVSPLVLDAIAGARWIVLAPGRPLEATLPAAAIPAIASALRSAPGQIIWIDDRVRTFTRSPDDLTLFRRHGVRIDVVLEVPRVARPRSRSDRSETDIRPQAEAAENDDQRRLGVALSEYLEIVEHDRA